MKEELIRKKVVNILEGDNWITWYPAKVKYKQNDIFGIIDLLAAKKRKRKNIQITTLSNVSDRRKKIKNFLKKSKIEMTIEIWAWNSIKKVFKIEKIGPRS
jgi:precorrin-3B methylase